MPKRPTAVAALTHALFLWVEAMDPPDELTDLLAAARQFYDEVTQRLLEAYVYDKIPPASGFPRQPGGAGAAHCAGTRHLTV